MMEFAFGYKQTGKGFIVHFGDKNELMEEGYTFSMLPRPHDAKREAMKVYRERGVKTEKYGYCMFEHGYEVIGGTEEELRSTDGIGKQLYDNPSDACNQADLRLQLDTYAEGEDSVFANELEKAWFDTNKEYYV